ncbi:hypothetical protein QP324_04190 [Corynebacterium sp. UMB0012]|uniref:hypothetical protein n=1 Tax=Corynebacterium sp. UMB0012 TaxID=3046344 RepID=UPI00254D7478|nr:hypothetical protein [Corynebacterium sp. UMB0012]MDK7047775.1 hypothetical protein [Corynebacterium sp. UMB0012]
MTTPTRQDIINAHDSLEELKRAALKSADFCGDTDHFLMCKDEILKVLPPKPRPTMDEVEWDDGEHFLAEAEQNIHGQVIMLGLDENGLIEYFVPRFHAQRYDAARPDTLTPTGRRYTLTEVQE